MATEVPKRIHLKGSGRHEEGVASVASIKPGHLIALDSANQLVPHPTAAGYAEKAFAIEDALQGKTIDDSYARLDVVSYVIAQPGDVIYAWLSNGETITVGEYLESNGNGELQAASAGVAIAVALEAVDTSDSESPESRIKVRVL